MTKGRIIELCRMCYIRGWKDYKETPHRFAENEMNISWKEFLEIVNEEIEEDKGE